MYVNTSGGPNAMRKHPGGSSKPNIIVRVRKCNKEKTERRKMSPKRVGKE